MARIKIKDLPKDMKVSKEEMRKVMGGLEYALRSSIIAYSASPPTSGAIRYQGAIQPINWGTPQYKQEDCKCMGMSQDPKTQLLPG